MTDKLVFNGHAVIQSFGLALNIICNLVQCTKCIMIQVIERIYILIIIPKAHDVAVHILRQNRMFEYLCP